MKQGRVLVAVGVLGVMAVVVAAAASDSRSPVPASSLRIDKLIDSLGDKDYAVRQWAEEELTQIGFPAFEALEAATHHEDLEIATRARYLLRKIKVQWVLDQDPPEVKRLLGDYERLAAFDRVERFRSLATLPDLKGIAPLCRLVRGEPSATFSGWAALAILCHEPLDRSARVRLAEIVRGNLAGSNRPAAQWVRTYQRLCDDPRGVLPEWTRLVKSEMTRWQQNPEKAHVQTVVGLLYLTAVGEVAAGDSATAEETVERARNLPLPSDRAAFEIHLQIVSMLARRGPAAWFEADGRRLMESDDAEIAINTGRNLAEYLHDHGKDLAAAEVYQKAFDRIGQIGPAVVLTNRSTGTSPVPLWRGRMNYFLGLHWSREHDTAKAVEHLELALQASPAEADYLIAGWRVVDAPPPFRDWVAATIDVQTALLRSRMSQPNAPAVYYNNFAWLVCNTKGDLDEALRASQKSLELSPNSVGYLDTLAHVYFAKGDLPNAVKYQTMAVQREPYSGILNSELKRFREALEAKNTKT
jgi:tetratricopeptide (TPR) repeat protein